MKRWLIFNKLYNIIKTNFGFRYSGRPSKQLLWYWLMRDMKLSQSYEVGIDAGCGAMLNRPWFRTNKYIGIDIDEQRLIEGKAKYPEVVSIRSRLEDAKNTTGDFILCVQVFANKHLDKTKTMNIVDSLVQMVSPGGVLIFNITKRNLPYEMKIDAYLNQHFTRVKKRKYGAMSRQNTILAPVIAALMYFLPFLRHRKEYTKIYYLCQDRYQD